MDEQTLAFLLNQMAEDSAVTTRLLYTIESAGESKILNDLNQGKDDFLSSLSQTLGALDQVRNRFDRNITRSIAQYKQVLGNSNIDS